MWANIFPSSLHIPGLSPVTCPQVRTLPNHLAFLRPIIALFCHFYDINYEHDSCSVY